MQLFRHVKTPVTFAQTMTLVMHLASTAFDRQIAEGQP